MLNWPVASSCLQEKTELAHENRKNKYILAFLIYRCIPYWVNWDIVTDLKAPATHQITVLTYFLLAPRNPAYLMVYCYHIGAGWNGFGWSEHFFYENNEASSVVPESADIPTGSSMLSTVRQTETALWCHMSKGDVLLVYMFLFLQWNDGWVKEQAGECDVAAVQLFLCAFALLLFVFPGWMNNALPGQSLTCPLITKGHPVGNTALTSHGKGYSRKTGTGGKMGGG